MPRHVWAASRLKTLTDSRTAPASDPPFTSIRPCPRSGSKDSVGAPRPQRRTRETNSFSLPRCQDTRHPLITYTQLAVHLPLPPHNGRHTHTYTHPSGHRHTEPSSASQPSPTSCQPSTDNGRSRHFRCLFLDKPAQRPPPPPQGLFITLLGSSAHTEPTVPSITYLPYHLTCTRRRHSCRHNSQQTTASLPDLPTAASTRIGAVVYTQHPSRAIYMSNFQTGRFMKSYPDG